MDEEDRHAHEDQRQRLRQRICPAGNGFVHDRAEQTDQPPHHHFNADEGNEVKVKTTDGFHNMYPLALSGAKRSRRAGYWSTPRFDFGFRYRAGRPRPYSTLRSARNHFGTSWYQL
ncbi:MAG: hypothetical protein MZV64_58955 [Ignavibacteriales bacterium]|nr:hypothetical protein [Ignavibacteriales bacterium]